MFYQALPQVHAILFCSRYSFFFNPTFIKIEGEAKVFHKMTNIRYRDKIKYVVLITLQMIYQHLVKKTAHFSFPQYLFMDPK